MAVGDVVLRVGELAPGATVTLYIKDRVKIAKMALNITQPALAGYYTSRDGENFYEITSEYLPPKSAIRIKNRDNEPHPYIINLIVY